jgi:ABC-type bacteriocin/lantibiotic exporter with double-glycine peptidase domain
MSFAVASRNLRDALVASVARLSASARQQVALISHDARSFLRLLARTFSGLPADVIAASVAINLLGLALPLAILQVYDRIVPHGATATLTLLMTGIACALVLEAILRITRSYVIAWSAMKLAWKTNVDAARRVVTAPAELVDAQPAARWIQRLQAVATVSEFNISSAPLVLIDLVFVVMFLPLLVACSRWIAGIPLAIFFLFGIAAIKRGRELRSATTGRASAEGKIRDFLIEVLNGTADPTALRALVGTSRRLHLRCRPHRGRCAEFRIDGICPDADRCLHDRSRPGD